MGEIIEKRFDRRSIEDKQAVIKKEKKERRQIRPSYPNQQISLQTIQKERQ